jgi:thymidine kinase
MNAGKTGQLIMSAHACSERNVKYCVIVPALSTERDDPNSTTYGYQLYSRAGFTFEAIPFNKDADLYKLIMSQPTNVHVLFVDEAQFLTPEQVIDLTRLVDELDIDVYAYGLRTDFKGNLFEGTASLFAWADKIDEIQTYAATPTKKKAMFNIKVGESGERIYEGDSISVGFGYKPVSRIEFDLRKNWHK